MCVCVCVCVCVCTYSSRYKSESPVVCRGRGHGHREGRAGPGHMTHREMGDWPIGLMTSHHSDDRFCSSGGESFKTHTHKTQVCPKFNTEVNRSVLCVFISPCRSSWRSVCDPEVVLDSACGRLYHSDHTQATLHHPLAT